jgi:hypothetical protein
MAEPRFVDLKWYEEQLTQLTKICKTIKRFYLMGGEPLLHPQLLEFMDVTRKCLPHTRLDMVTNAILIKKWGIPFWESLRRNNIRLMVSLYPNIQVDTEYMKQMAKLYKVTLWLRDCGNWSVVFNPKGDSDSGKAFRVCFAKFCYVLYDGKLYLCPRPAFVHMYNQAKGTDIKVSDNEYVDIFKEGSKDKAIKLSVKSTWGITNDKWVRILDKLNDIGMFRFINILIKYGFIGQSPKKQHLEFCRYCADKRVWIKWDKGI